MSVIQQEQKKPKHVDLIKRCSPTRHGSMFSNSYGPQTPSENRVPAILVPGMIVSGSYMIPFGVQLGAHRMVHIIDFPGFGRSEKRDEPLDVPDLADSIADWMDANRLTKAHLIANSFGCQVLADFAARYPEKVARLVFQGPTVDPRARSVWRQLIRLKINSYREKKSVGTISVHDYHSAGLSRIYSTIRVTLRDRIEDKLPAIQAPVLIVRGDRDVVVPQRWAEEVARMIPKAALELIPGGAHTLNYSEPEKFAAVVEPFLETDE
jgi:2-hydroxy-6-oxonona-2,4-dienedioate hydrolase